MSSQIKVLLVDDHTAVREGYKILLTQFNINVIGETEDGKQVLTEYQKLKPDLVLMDLSIKGMNGLECTRRLLNHHPNAKIIIFSMHDSVNFVNRAIQYGAMGYVLKSDPSSTLVSAINQVYYQTKRFLSNEVASMVALHSLNDYADKILSLSPREHAIFLLLIEKKSRSQIAETLSLSLSTVSNYKTSLMNKLNVKSLDDLIALAIENNALKQNQLEL